MADSTPDLWDTCYEGEHRKLLAPEQFKQMFCDVCMNAGCRNSRGFGTKWNQRIRTQEDRLLINPQFAPDGTAELMGLPDFQSMLRDTIVAEISTRKNDWEPVSDEEVAREAARMMGIDVPAPKGFQEPEPQEPEPQEPEPQEPEPQEPEPQEPEPQEPEPQEPEPQEPEPQEPEPQEPEPQEPEPQEPEPDPEPEPQEPATAELSAWRVQGDSKDPRTGRPVEYDVTLATLPDGSEDWSCSCPSRETPCKHIRHIQARLVPPEPDEPPPDPVRPPPSPRGPLPSGMNTSTPQGGIMLGGGPPPAKHDPGSGDAVDPWEPPKHKEERVIEVGGRVSFGSGKNPKK